MWSRFMTLCERDVYAVEHGTTKQLLTSIGKQCIVNVRSSKVHDVGDNSGIASHRNKLTHAHCVCVCVCVCIDCYVYIPF